MHTLVSLCACVLAKMAGFRFLARHYAKNAASAYLSLLVRLRLSLNGWS
jgi:hypothetical protein